MSATLPEWASDPALAVVWARVRTRFEAGGLVAQGRTVVPLHTRDERHALGALLGESVTRDRVSVDLAALDRRLRQRSGLGGLFDVLPLVTGAPLSDRPALRAESAASREEPLLLALELVPTAWAGEWVNNLRRHGLLTHRADALEVVRQAAAVLLAVVEPARGVARSRVELAAQVVGDAHALDQDRLLHQVVVRGLAAASGASVPVSAAARRALWEDYGVAPDLVSRTCLMLGLAPSGDGPLARRLDLAAEAGDPVHLTDWDLKRIPEPWQPGRSVVLVCENPRVLEAIAERQVARQPVVCTSGEPNTVVTRLLERLTAAGHSLRYHGDFDWSGIAIANRLVQRFGATPWRMGAVDYEEQVRPDAPRLSGIEVEAAWDPDLSAAMRVCGRALHEEAILPTLLDALAEIAP